MQELTDEWLSLPTNKGRAITGLKVPSSENGVVARENSIVDIGLLRHGGWPVLHAC